jgi:peptide/nickel transport system permease protein
MTKVEDINPIGSLTQGESAGILATVEVNFNQNGISPWKLSWDRFVHCQMPMVGLFSFIGLIALVLLAPILGRFSPTNMDPDSLLVAPNRVHLFGTDDLGRDVFSRTLWGGQETLRVGLLGVAIAIGGGVLLGLLSAYAGGWVDTLVQRLIEILLAFPVILLLLSVIAIMGTGLQTIIFALGISNIPWYARMVRGSVLSIKNNLYIDATRALGASDWRIMFTHILPNMISPILVYGTLELGNAIMMTAGLSYIGLGAQPPSPEWGAMLSYGRNYLLNAWWMSFFPGLGVTLAVLSINLIGEGLRDALDPKMVR